MAITHEAARQAPSSSHAPSADGTSAKSARTVAIACLVGATIEWFDFFIYGTAAALIFSTQFFPKFSPVAATLAAFSTFAIGFFARPIGGIVMGHFGDRIGRKAMLVLSLLMMGIGTFAIGLLPTYAQIGLAAPVLLVLLRLCQGFGVGGEWSGAILMAVEHAPPDKRGFYGGFPQLGVAAGLVLANTVFLVIGWLLTEEQFQAWGWRLPFLFSIVLVAVGLYVRHKVSESPIFEEAQRRGKATRSPLKEVLKNHKKPVFIAALACLAQNGMGYVVLVYVLNYGITQLGLTRSTMLGFIIIANILEIFATLYFASLSDRIGRRKVFLMGTGAGVLWALAFFPIVDTAVPALVLLAIVVARLCIAAMYGPMAALFCELFEPSVRFSGTSLGYQAGSIVGGALAPFIATLLFVSTGTSMSISLYMAGLCLISFIAIYSIAETHVNRPAR